MSRYEKGCHMGKRPVLGWNGSITLRALLGAGVWPWLLPQGVTHIVRVTSGRCPLGRCKQKVGAVAQTGDLS